MQLEFMNGLAKKLTDAVSARQQEQQRAASVTAAAKQNVASVARETAALAAPIEQGILERAAATQRSRELRDSGKFGDRIELATRRLLQPGLYNPEVRAQRDAQDSNVLTLLNATQAAKVGVIETQLQAATAGVAVAGVQEAIALEQFKAIATQQDLQTENLLASQRLQRTVLDGLTKDEAAASIEDAARLGQDFANVNGVDIPVDFLIEQNNALVDREFALQAARDATTDEQRSRAQQFALNTMSATQLNGLLLDGGVSGDGEEFRIEDVETAFNRRQRTEAESVSAQVAQFNVENLLPRALTSASNQVTQLEKNGVGNSQLTQVTQQSKLALGAANAALRNGDPVLAATLLDSAQQNLTASIAQVAKRESLGNPQVEQLLNDFYSTGQVNGAQAVAVGVAALTSGKSLVSVFPPAFAQAAQTAFNEERNIMRSEATVNGLGQKPTAGELKAIDEQAAQIAVLRAANQTALEIHTFVVQNQVNAPDHPLKGRMTPEQFGTMTAIAKQSALNTVATQLDVTPEEVRGMLSSGLIPDNLVDKVGSVDELRSTLNFAAALSREEQLGPRDAARVLAWLETRGTEYASRVAGSFPQSATGVQSATALALSADVAQQQWFEHVATTAAASQERGRQANEKAAALVEASDLFRNEALVLGNTPDLSDDDRRLLWPSLRSVINDVSRLQLEPQAATLEFTKRIGQLKFQDAATTRAMRLFSANHAAAADTLQATGQGLTLFQALKAANERSNRGQFNVFGKGAFETATGRFGFLKAE